MRVISGSAKGRRLRAVPGLDTRPTADRVRQTIFDILGDVTEQRVLDLFAGTGALGIEALSRGAAAAMFVEKGVVAARVLEHNLALTGFDSISKVVKQDAEKVVSGSSSSSSGGFDLVFLDPPYERGLAFIARLAARLAEGGWVASGGTVVAEGPAGKIEAPEGFREFRTRAFGRTHVTFLSYEPDGDR